MASMDAKSRNHEHTTNGIVNGVNGNRKVPHAASQWADPTTAAFDFRSDVTTRPTNEMLQAIIDLEGSGLGDDVFLEDTTTSGLEAFIADLTGCRAALLVMSGTMGNQLSIRTHLQGPPHSVVADSRSHIMGWEAGGLASLSHALAVPVSPSNDHHLTLPDIKKHTITSKDIHACPTRLICLENTLAGTILPLADASAISTWARKQSPPINMHLDGARLWEAIASQTEDADQMRKNLQEYCACFDSISLCFSKGLGAPIGSIIVGSQAFIDRARHVRKALGGGLRQAAIITAPARVAVEQTFLGGELKASHDRAKEVARMWIKKGGKLQHETETNMVWLDLEAVGLGLGDSEQEGEDVGCVKGGKNRSFVEMAADRGIRVMGGRLVVHYQISSEATSRLSLLFDDIFALAQPGKELPRPPVADTIKKKADKLIAPQVE